MANAIVTLYRTSVFTNVLIAIAAVAQCLLTYEILGMETHLFIVLIEGAATLLLYNASLWLSKPANPERSPYERTRWVFGHLPIFWSLSALSAIVLLFSLSQVHWESVAFLAFVGIISMAYGLPLFRFGEARGGLRQVPGLKLFHIAVVWSLSSVGLPVVEAWAGGQALDWTAANYLGLLKILFLLICTLPFDIRDMQQDSYYHLKTIPNLIGERPARLLCYLFILVHTILVWVAPYLIGIKIGLIATNLLIVILLKYMLFRRPNNYHQVYLLDTALIAQYVLVWLFAQMH